MTRLNCTVPAFLSIDVEPDGFQLSRSDPPAWAGYEAVVPVIQDLRERLFVRSGVLPKFGWYFRMDPQIAEVYGRPDYVVQSYSEFTDRLRGRGDYLGIHSHPVRWSAEQNLWIHDFADPDWSAYCAKFALDAFHDHYQFPAERFRGGAAFMNNRTIEVIEAAGVKVDLTLEPVAWPASFLTVPSGIDESPYIGVHSDLCRAPRTAYRPSRADFTVPDAKGGRSTIMIPMATYVTRQWQPLLRRTLDRLVRRQPSGKVRVLHLSEPWPDPVAYWDLVAAEIETMRRPYLSLAVRTDAPGSPPLVHSLTLLHALLEHPLSKRLCFRDPVEIAANLI